MAKLTLDIKCVEAALAAVLKNYIKRITVRIDANDATLAFATVIGVFKFKMRCTLDEPSHRIRIALTSPMGTGILLRFKRTSILKQYPFIEKLETDECVIDFNKIDLGGIRPADWIELRRIRMPEAENVFCSVEFTIKEQN